MGNKETNRLHRDQSFLQKSQKRTGDAIMERKHDAAKTTRNHTNGHNPTTAKKYRAEPSPVAGTQIRYDINKLRREPRKLSNGLNKQNEK